MSTTFTDQLLTNLNVLSKIQPGSRLCVRNGYLTHDVSNSYLRPILRYIRHDNRATTILHIKGIMNDLEFIIACNETSTDYKWVSDKIQSIIPKVVDGLNNLKGTYIHDSLTHAQLNVIIERISTFNKK